MLNNKHFKRFNSNVQMFQSPGSSCGKKTVHQSVVSDRVHVRTSKDNKYILYKLMRGKSKYSIIMLQTIEQDKTSVVINNQLT